jgi:hypothetical protein
VLEDAKKLADLKVENDDILALCFMQDGESCQRQLLSSCTLMVNCYTQWLQTTRLSP